MTMKGSSLIMLVSALLAAAAAGATAPGAAVMQQGFQPPTLSHTQRVLLQGVRQNTSSSDVALAAPAPAPAAAEAAVQPGNSSAVLPGVAAAPVAAAMAAPAGGSMLLLANLPFERRSGCQKRLLLAAAGSHSENGVEYMYCKSHDHITGAGSSCKWVQVAAGASALPEPKSTLVYVVSSSPALQVMVKCVSHAVLQQLLLDGPIMLSMHWMTSSWAFKQQLLRFVARALWDALITL